RKLQIALGQSVLCSFEVSDVATDAKQSFALTIRRTNIGAFNRDPTLLSITRSTGDRRQAVFGSHVITDTARGYERFVEAPQGPLSARKPPPPRTFEDGARA